MGKIHQSNGMILTLWKIFSVPKFEKKLDELMGKIPLQTTDKDNMPDHLGEKNKSFILNKFDKSQKLWAWFGMPNHTPLKILTLILEHFDLKLEFLCIALGKKILLPYKLISLSFRAIFNLTLPLRWSKKISPADLSKFNFGWACLTFPSLCNKI